LSLLQRSTLVLALLSAFTLHQTAKAQTSVYAAATLTSYGFSDNSDFAFNSDSGGLTLGAFYNFPIQSRLTAGIDGRLEESFAHKGGFNSTVALRIGFVPTKVRLRPYFQIGGGVAHSSYDTFSLSGQNATTSNSVTSGVVQFLIGLDVRLTHSLDWRALEYGADAPTANGIATGVGFLDTGLVYHLHAAK
jgi:hypothetical protein